MSGETPSYQGTKTKLRPIVIDGVSIEPKSELHRRKLGALRVFVERLLDTPAREDVVKVILFGSAAAGEVWDESDVDVLVFGAGRLSVLDDLAGQVAYETGLETGESVEPLIGPMSDLYVPDSYFVFSTIRYGKEVYSVGERELVHRAAENNYLLAREYLEAAEEARRAGQRRVAVDVAYNAAELCAKGFLLGKVQRMPTKHGSVINLFSNLYIKTDIYPSHVGRQLNRSLNYRNKARYEYEAEITEEMADKTIALAQSMIEFLAEYIQKEWPDE